MFVRVNNKEFYSKKKLSNGMTACAEFTVYDEGMDFCTYNMSFFIYKKRNEYINKDIFNKISTGDGTIEGLLFAKECLLEFENKCQDSFGNYNIVVYGDTKKKRRIYGRYLLKNGYSEVNLHGVILFMKKIRG